MDITNILYAQDKKIKGITFKIIYVNGKKRIIILR